MRVVVENVRPSPNRHLRLVPNINRSGRRLPEQVGIEDLVRGAKVDGELATRRLSDQEIYSVIVDISDADLSSFSPSLVILFEPQLFRVLNRSGIPITGKLEGSVNLDLVQERKDSTKSRGSGIQFFLEALTFVGSPLVQPKARVDVTFRFVDANGQLILEQTRLDGSDVRTADLILVGDDAEPERLFICDVEENQPSVREVMLAAAAVGVPTTIVPRDVNMGDSWLQDQFQAGFTAASGNAQRIVVHLPRMVNDSALFPQTPNLRNFVDAFFPSNDIGVVKDFWKLKIGLDDGQNAAEFDVAETYVPYKKLVRAVELLNAMHQKLEAEKIAIDPLTLITDKLKLYDVRMAIDRCFSRMSAALSAKPKGAGIVKGFAASIRALSETLKVARDTVELTMQVEGKAKTFVFDEKNKNNLTEFFVGMYSIHSSYNYGGNIEVSPPVGDARYGKIICGTVASPALQSFLTSRGAHHPFASVYTGWLEVGHIDEIMCFAGEGESGFCAVRAAPRLAISLLEKLVEEQANGRLVTRLFRGKKWIHKSASGASHVLPPPAAYSTYVAKGPYNLSGLGQKLAPDDTEKFVHAAFHDDRRFMVFNTTSYADATYAAFISCRDLLGLCKRTNEGIEDLYLSDSYRYADNLSYGVYQRSPGADEYREKALPYRLDPVLKTQFEGISIFHVPVLFDTMASLFDSQTKAITPDIVNLQRLGRAVLVPRPYGPRMRVPNAVEFIKGLPDSIAPPRDGLDEKFIRSRGLDKTWHWTGAHEKVWQAKIGTVPTDFDADYEEYLEAVRRAVITSNAIHDAPVIYKNMDAVAANHPVAENEDLRAIAEYFRDGFDQFKNSAVDYCEGDIVASHPRKDRHERDIALVMDQIRGANPGIFDANGQFLSKGWTRIEIPEETVDILELYTELLFTRLGMEIHWVDSWYYHTHSGGIHCGTNVLRRPSEFAR